MVNSFRTKPGQARLVQLCSYAAGLTSGACTCTAGTTGTGTTCPGTRTTGPATGTRTRARPSACTCTSTSTSTRTTAPGTIRIGGVARISRSAGISILVRCAMGTGIHAPCVVIRAIITMGQGHRSRSGSRESKGEQSAVNQWLLFHVFLQSLFRGLHESRKNTRPMVQQKSRNTRERSNRLPPRTSQRSNLPYTPTLRFTRWLLKIATSQQARPQPAAPFRPVPFS